MKKFAVHLKNRFIGGGVKNLLQGLNAAKNIDNLGRIALNNFNGYPYLMLINFRRYSLMIEKCCICGSDVKTEKILPYRDYLIGSGVEIYNMHLAHCNNCGFIFLKNPFTPEQLENRYKNESCAEFNSSNFVLNGNDDYIGRCHRQKHFIEENLASERHLTGGCMKVFWKLARHPAII